MNLQSVAAACFVTGRPFEAGDRVTSCLVRDPKTAEIVRYDLGPGAFASFVPPGQVACSWVQPFKPRRPDENPGRAMKLTADALFVTLADPLTEPTEENTRLLQFLALLLERKKLLRPRGVSPDGLKNLYEHARSKLMYEVPVGELTPAFFLQVQQQLSVLVGAPKAPVVAATV